MGLVVIALVPDLKENTNRRHVPKYGNLFSHIRLHCSHYRC